METAVAASSVRVFIVPTLLSLNLKSLPFLSTKWFASKNLRYAFVSVRVRLPSSNVPTPNAPDITTSPPNSAVPLTAGLRSPALYRVFLDPLKNSATSPPFAGSTFGLSVVIGFKNVARLVVSCAIAANIGLSAPAE